MELSQLVDRAAGFCLLPAELIDGPHGVSHWERTAIFAGWIAEEVEFELTIIQKNVILMSAICHDIGRTHDGYDHMHGYAGVLPTIRFMDSIRVLDRIHVWHDSGMTVACHPAGHILDIVMHHSAYKGTFSEMKIVMDADRLDHMRFGKETLLADRLELAASERLVERAWKWIAQDVG